MTDIAFLKGEVHLRRPIFSQRGRNLASATALFLGGLALCVFVRPVGALADIGTRLEQTNARSALHGAKHRGRHPRYATNEKGIVIRECWQAPVGGWTKPQAMSLVRDLVPEALKRQNPLRKKRSPSGEMFAYKDGTTVWLEHSAVKPTFRLVAVWAPEYRGPKC